VRGGLQCITSLKRSFPVDRRGRHIGQRATFNSEEAWNAQGKIVHIKAREGLRRIDEKEWTERNWPWVRGGGSGMGEFEDISNVYIGGN